MQTMKPCKRVYISGKITGLPFKQCRAKFKATEDNLKAMGYEVINPFEISAKLPKMKHHEYMHICKPLLDLCDAIIMQSDWQDSEGAKMEYNWAIDSFKVIMLEVEHF